MGKAKRVHCDCERWETCVYGDILKWAYVEYEVCGISYLKSEARGCSVDKCNKYIKRTTPRSQKKRFNLHI